MGAFCMNQKRLGNNFLPSFSQESLSYERGGHDTACRDGTRHGTCRVGEIPFRLSRWVEGHDMLLIPRSKVRSLHGPSSQAVKRSCFSHSALSATRRHCGKRNGQQFRRGARFRGLVQKGTNDSRNGRRRGEGG